MLELDIDVLGRFRIKEGKSIFTKYYVITLRFAGLCVNDLELKKNVNNDDRMAIK